MKTIVLDGNHMLTKEAAHDYLAEKLALPAYYGKNLDALYDCLNEMRDLRLVICHRQEMEDALGQYGTSLLNTLIDAARETPAFTLFFDGEEDK